MGTWRVAFPGTAFPPAELPDLASLSELLTVQNSPLLFGCRSGLCGTCLIEVEESGAQRLEPPGAEEAEALEIYAPGNARARLACQIHICAHLRVWKIQSA
jgi:ferredoxin